MENGCSFNQRDDDQDGLLNPSDLCPDTASGVSVDENGCSNEQLNADADEDADNDGLSNLCEYQWQQIRLLVLEQGLSTHNETSEGASTWVDTDPNLADSDGDGLLVGCEMLFTDWNSNDGLWTLNPLVAGDGDYDADNDGLTDRQELSLVEGLPDNGVFHPPDAPIFYLDAEEQMSGTEFSRVGNILNNTENRATLVKLDLIDWQSGNPPTLILETLRSITDPTHNDTDRDEMLDGYEYWFTEWDLEENRWSMNPLISNDIYLDLDDDSYDCDGDGEIAVYEVYSNLREWQARTYGKEAERYNVPLELGFYDYATDAINALSEEEGLDNEQANNRLYDLFSEKLHDGLPVTQNRLDKINELNEDNFNNSLIGISDPTHPDSDSDGMPDGWEYCYSTYISESIPVSRDDNIFTVQSRWGLNPLNPVSYTHLTLPTKA